MKLRSLGTAHFIRNEILKIVVQFVSLGGESTHLDIVQPLVEYVPHSTSSAEIYHRFSSTRLSILWNLFTRIMILS